MSKLLEAQSESSKAAVNCQPGALGTGPTCCAAVFSLGNNHIPSPCPAHAREVGIVISDELQGASRRRNNISLGLFIY